jgi:hypothetical protein
MRFFMLMFTVVLNFETVGIRFPVRNFRDFPFLCLLLVPHVKLAPLLDVHRPHIPFENIQTYSANIWLHLIIF